MKGLKALQCFKKWQYKHSQSNLKKKKCHGAILISAEAGKSGVWKYARMGKFHERDFHKTDFHIQCPAL